MAKRNESCPMPRIIFISVVSSVICLHFKTVSFQFGWVSEWPENLFFHVQFSTITPISHSGQLGREKNFRPIISNIKIVLE